MLYLHLVLLSKNIFPVLEFVVNPPHLPYRIVANRRRTAQRVQKRIQTGHRGTRRPRLSAANIGSDHVNLGHGECTVYDHGSLLFTILLTAVFTLCTEIFSRDPTKTTSVRLFSPAFPNGFQRFTSYFFAARSFFTSPTRIYHLLRSAP